MKKGKILLSLSILAALGSFSAPLSWAADVTNPAKKVNTTVEGNVSAGVAENEGDNAVSNILTLDTGADISGKRDWRGCGRRRGKCPDKYSGCARHS